MMIEWAIAIAAATIFVTWRRRQHRSWLGLLNHDLLQWTGWRLTYIQGTKPKQWRLCRMKAGTGWFKTGKGIDAKLIRVKSEPKGDRAVK